MIVKHFDTTQGIYAFIEEGLDTQAHQHPAMEVLLVKSGTVDITLNGIHYPNIQACLIAPNTTHAVSGPGASCEIWIIERDLSLLVKLHPAFTHLAENAIVFLTPAELSDFDDKLLEQLVASENSFNHWDVRIAECVQYIRTYLPDQPINREVLSKHVHLSPTRLSHLFKAEVGTSLQNYMVWERLKYAIATTFKQDINLLNAAYQAGFYDAAHFSRAFQKMFGLNPSTGYNSSILQI